MSPPGAALAYMGGIARSNRMKALAVGGIADHCHILLSLPPTMTVAKAIQLDARRNRQSPLYMAGRLWSIQHWSVTPATIRYILNQPRHHRKIRFEDEWNTILERHADFTDED